MKQQIIEGGRRQKVVIEYRDNGWWVMHDDGQIEEWDTAEWALKSVRKAAQRRKNKASIAEESATKSWQSQG